MEFIIKNSPHKIDPKHPESTDPNYKKAYRKGQEVLARGGLKFEDRGAEEHYWKMVNSNPSNVPGLPAFYPPQQVKVMGMPEIRDMGVFEKVYWLRKSAGCEGDLWCPSCSSIQPFSVGQESSFCKKCGTHFKFHN